MVCGQGQWGTVLRRDVFAGGAVGIVEGHDLFGALGTGGQQDRHAGQHSGWQRNQRKAFPTACWGMATGGAPEAINLHKKAILQTTNLEDGPGSAQARRLQPSFEMDACRAASMVWARMRR
ncbi:hypothetical protein GCM10010840_28520 [Deinococcus aerolatus]|uniref:Uncharacterized protein n=1 Tax=Deinococcus aerolatus TaxID=522487 RepID=A0ABQ2GE31_9DEIO|nr:hypothetical protein GCM10010840_28520 [Deinococcus aerolatus]